MAIDWPTIDAALVEQVSLVTEISDVRWAWESSAWRMPETHVTLKRSGVTPIGIDVRERNYNQVTDELDANQVGRRSFVLEVRADSVRGASGASPEDVLAMLRTRLYRPSVLAALYAAGVSLSTVSPVRSVPAKRDGREWAVAILEVTLLVTDIDADAPDTWIEKVQVRSEFLRRPDGTQAPEQVEIEIP
jgi:hypothetical protein